MATFKKYVFLTAVISVTAMALAVSGCARKKKSEMVVAVINDYRMTVGDFDYESHKVLSMGKLLGEMPATKEDILDALVVKELLLQEAQKRDLDKDRSFMKTIELYWEQTLIKNLLTKKYQELDKIADVYEDEITEYYNKMKNKIRAQALVLQDEKAGRRLLSFDGDVAAYAQGDPEKTGLLYVIPSTTYVLGEDISPLEESVFNISGGKKRELVPLNGKWALILIEERIPAQPGPLAGVKEEIIKNIKMWKEKKMMNEWIEALRSGARIKIDKKLLSELR